MTWADTNIPSQRHAGSGATALRRGAYVTGFVAAGFVGRATIVDDQALALIWPAAGVALLWFLGGPEGRWSWADVALLAAATFTVNGLTGSTPAAAGILVVANVVQVVTIVALTHRWAPELSGREQHRTLDNPATLSRFILAISAGAAIGTAIGVAGLAAITGFFSVEATLTWWGRNVCGALAVAATGILLTHRVLQHRGGLPLRPYPTARLAELGALAGSSAHFTTCCVMTSNRTRRPTRFGCWPARTAAPASFRSLPTQRIRCCETPSISSARCFPPRPDSPS
ncbi:hypothetical protein [Aeromicrobium sp.]|uniref:hypothetical protein n=1 Tax=Aeromicrobium sp. TaxID=1871063 RepID=UPI0025C5C60A|nr:hypothetical protein [Aeromicrobium sp.]MCK5891788.1 hypothetical protein [Aeromicrobium sp.]